MELVVIGSSNVDLVITLPKIPAIGETVLGGKSAMIFGGKGANQAVTAIRSGGDVAFITKLGIDIFGENTKAHFLREGFPEKYILKDQHEATGIAQIFVSAKGENSIAVAPGANMHLLPADIQPFEAEIKKAKLVLAQLEIPIETVEYIAAFAARNQVKFILNPAPAQTLSDALLKNTWLLTPNETEAEILTGIKITGTDTAEKAAELLLQKGVQHVIITMGENGCLLHDRSGTVHYKAYREKAVDTTAAGDVFNGVLAVAITKGFSFANAIETASAAAAISVTRHGAQSSIPYQDEIEEYLASAKNT
ncbi:ribokinase [Flavihumibacter profundi]|uniref:ribokinase n=1 Tax=Flavihumibacter profundi TaxID=2716883 RepID=UPI001CC5EB23|nr:ribokinase [Flavihumibacter profundi]MBZ5858579.1 ribokinase [Flavihumibacter profundi]